MNPVSRPVTSAAAPGVADAGRELAVRARDVRKRYREAEVLRGIDLDVEDGRVVCLIGRSGSGKSTFLRCISHLESIDGGELRVYGDLIGYEQRKGRLYELRERAVAARRTSIGMVFQQFNLFPHMTVLQNITEAPAFHRRGSATALRQEARELLDRVGLADKERAYPRELSGGQQQRVAIARALAMHPKLMLFDEPTSALDPELVSEVLEVMLQLAADGTTMIVVTHQMDFARRVADSVVFMDAGVIVESGPPGQLLDHPEQEATRQFLARISD